MPILNIKALPQNDPELVQRAMKRTNLAIAEVCNCDPKHVWSTWAELESGCYVEGDRESVQQPHDTHPPICELICFEGHDQDKIEQILKVTASTLGEELGIENNVFVYYREVKSGQVVTGDGIVRK